MRYDPKTIESKWQKKWFEEKTFEPDFRNPRGKGPFYNLMMFPYPSAEGLHIGNVRTFTGVDIYGRFKRMQGYDVFEPIGLDGFGIHSENYAIKIGQQPMDLSRITEKNFYRQLGSIGNAFAWDERLETYDPEYYQWTQWIFTQMFKHGLAYRKKQAVNWCPSCLTVLADEQVISGECERCGANVEKRELEQWFFRITNFAAKLYKNLETLDWDERVKIAQKNWIGPSEGAEIEFLIHNVELKIKVFTTRPDTLFGATFLVVSPELATSWLDSGWKASDEVRRYVEDALAKRVKDTEEPEREKSGVFSGLSATNPANNEKIPVWVADYVLSGYGTGAVMAVPAHDQRDFEFAQKFNLEVRIVVCPHFPETTCPILDRAYEDAGHLVASARFDGMPSEPAKWEITKFVGGEKKTQYRLRDWLVSRQRYWGPPIPMIFCETCKAAGKGERPEMPGWYAVPEQDLPVKLPYVENFRPTGTGAGPLALVPEFINVKCPGCGGVARRETDVSDTFLDSAWYFLRYPSVRDSKRAWDPEIIKTWLPVHMYIGGLEHSVLHLLYSRFVTMALHDMGWLNFDEPFRTFRGHGLIVKDGAKMSKSKGNIVSPDDYISAYGADALRTYEAFLAPLPEGGDFRDAGIRGMARFLERIWKFGCDPSRFAPGGVPVLQRTIAGAVRKITRDIERLHYNTAISALMVLLNAFEDAPSVGQDDWRTLVKLLAPFAPHLAEELWRGVLGEPESIHRSSWPIADVDALKKDSAEIIVQVNGRVRDRITVSAGLPPEEAEKKILERPSVQRWIGGKPVKKFIYVPGRIANLVVDASKNASDNAT